MTHRMTHLRYVMPSTRRTRIGNRTGSHRPSPYQRPEADNFNTEESSEYDDTGDDSFNYDSLIMTHLMTHR